MLVKLILALLWLSVLLVWFARYMESITEEKVLKRLEEEIYSSKE